MPDLVFGAGHVGCGEQIGVPGIVATGMAGSGRDGMQRNGQTDSFVDQRNGGAGLVTLNNGGNGRFAGSQYSNDGNALDGLQRNGGSVSGGMSHSGSTGFSMQNNFWCRTRRHAEQ